LAKKKKGPFQSLLEQQLNTTPQQVRQQRVELMQEIQQLRGRPLVTYATNIEISAPGVPTFIHPQDIVPLTEVLDSVEGDALDFLLETPGGLAEVTVDIVNLLRPRFKHVSFIVPHFAMSAGTMLVMSGDEILMDHRSSLGAIDPQFMGPDGRPQPAQAILTGIDTIKKEVDANNGNLHPVYVPILRNVDPGRLQSALNASELSRVLVTDWLAKYKFREWSTHSSTGLPVEPADRQARAREIAENLCHHQNWLSHSRPIKIPELEQLRLKITDYGRIPELQQRIWALWVNLHFFMTSSNVYKVYESDSVELYKLALNQNQPAQIVPMPIPVGGPQSPAQAVAIAQFAIAGLKCKTCGTNYKVQLNFVPNVPLQAGSDPFPKSGNFTCRTCQTVHNLTGLKMQVEVSTKRPVVF
jgi:ATP-dependent protease ClpP protease subunit